MIEFIRIILLLGIVGAAVTFAGNLARWWMDDQRRMRRLVRRVLGGSPDGVIVAPGRGAAAAFRLASNQALVMRDGGADALLYPLRLLMGAELIVDDHVVARAMRDEPRRVLDQVSSSASTVVLRLLFDDPRHPDFSLDLWVPRDGLRKDARPPAAAIREARGWLARAEAILRRTGGAAADPGPAPGREFEQEPEPDDASAPVPETAWAAEPEQDIPPWEDSPAGFHEDALDADDFEPDDGGDANDGSTVDASGQPRLL